jgi:VanZ family protein
MALIFIASSWSDPAPLPEYVSDKLLHFLVFALLGMLLLRALAGGRLGGISWRRALAAVALAALYGLSDELHQSIVPNREPDVMDVAADALGAAAGAAVLASLKVLRKVYFDDPRSG